MTGIDAQWGPSGQGVSLELPEGLTADGLAELLAHGRAGGGAGWRVGRLVRALLALRVPFAHESDLPPAPPGILRLHLRSMDCATFVYNVLGMSGAANPKQFADTMRIIRYRDGVVQPGNLLHYASNVMEASVRAGLVQEVTTVVARGARLGMRTVQLGVRSDGQRFLAHPCGDQNLGAAVSVAYLPTEALGEVASEILDGDVLLFITSKPPAEFPLLTGHLGFAFRDASRGQDLFLAHCSRSPLGNREGRPAGVCLATCWDDERRALVPDGPLRTVEDYLRQNPQLFSGLVVFRPCP